MIYISKGKGRRKGVQLVKRFVHSKWDRNIHQYVNLCYDELKRVQDFKRLLMDEQGGVCCYCMRKLSNNNITLEHIIPFSLSEKNLWHIHIYQQMKFLSKKRVTYIKEDEMRHSKYISIPPTPHFIAYENLVASCNGLKYGAAGSDRKLHQTCNNKRGNKLIVPFFYNPELVQSVKYQIDGTYYSKNDEVEGVMDLVKLNERMLVLFRKAWAAFVIEGVDLHSITSNPDDPNHREEITDYLSGYINREERKSLAVKSDYWKTFLDFEWFYAYYQKHIPRWKRHA